MSYAKIMPRRGTAYEWTTENPILAEGELGVEFPDSGIGTGLCRFKFGDGFKPWNQLAYAFDGASANSIVGGNAYNYHLILLRQDYHQNWLEVNPVLEDGEIIYTKDYLSFKMGDGVSRYDKLPWVGRQYDFDFGDEDAPSTASLSAMSSEPTATLADLMEDTIKASSTKELLEGVPVTLSDNEGVLVGAVVEDQDGKTIGNAYSIISEAPYTVKSEAPTEEVVVEEVAPKKKSRKKSSNTETE